MKEPEKSFPPLVIIGMGDDGLDGLPLVAVRELFNADILYTSRRLEQMLPEEVQARTHLWPSPFDLMVEDIRKQREAGRQVVVVTSGNPFWHGAGALLARHFPHEDIVVHPAPSSFSLACARMGWAMQETEKLSLHGRRSPALVETFIQPGCRLLLLANNGRTPLEVSSRLVRRGFGSSRLTVLAHLNGPEESRHDMTARTITDLEKDDFPDLHVLAVECIPDGPHAQVLPLVPGLPDDAFEHDGQITKQAVRAVTVSALMPRPGAMLWDVGAGCGSVAVEWLRIAGLQGRACAIERDVARCRMISNNADMLGVPHLEVVCDEVPDALHPLPEPDAIFIGTAAESEEIFDYCLDALKPGGILVANAVTAGGEAALAGRHERLGGELVRLAVSRAAPLGSKKAMRPALPVTQFRLRKT